MERSDAEPALHPVHEHIELIARHEQDFLASRTAGERFADRVANVIGSVPYVVAHVAVFTAWIVWNVAPGFHHFDPFPFPLIDTVFAFEAILVASFILMRQSRMSRRSDERDQLMLQILLLTEREITALLGMERQVAQHVGLENIDGDQEISQFTQQTSIDDVAQIIQENIPIE
jgi:uncharacterized membrane protein